MKAPKLVALGAILALATLVGSNSAHAVQQPWYLDYDYAIKSVQKGNFSDAEEVLQQLIGDDGVSRADVFTYGSWTVDYTPYYYLALALQGRDQLSEAAACFKLELSFGVVQRSQEKMRVIRQFQQLRGSKNVASSAP